MKWTGMLMMKRGRNAVATTAAVMVLAIVVIVGTLGAATFALQSQQIQASCSSSMTSSTEAYRGLSSAPDNLTLYTLATADRMLNRTLPVPLNPDSVISPFSCYRDLRVIGVDVQRASSPDFMVDVYLWNGAFVNGTTARQQIMESGGVMISENSFATFASRDPALNLTDAYQSLVNQSRYVVITEGPTLSNGPRSTTESTATLPIQKTGARPSIS